MQYFSNTACSPWRSVRPSGHGHRGRWRGSLLAISRMVRRSAENDRARRVFWKVDGWIVGIAWIAESPPQPGHQPASGQWTAWARHATVGLPHGYSRSALSTTAPRTDFHPRHAWGRVGPQRDMERQSVMHVGMWPVASRQPPVASCQRASCGPLSAGDMAGRRRRRDGWMGHSGRAVEGSGCGRHKTPKPASKRMARRGFGRAFAENRVYLGASSGRAETRWIMGLGVARPVCGNAEWRKARRFAAPLLVGWQCARCFCNR